MVPNDDPLPPKLSILIVDDDPDLYALITLNLRNENHRVELASAGRIALTLLSLDWFDVLVTDLMLPDMNGLELLDQVRAAVDPVQLRRMAIIVCTATAGSVDKWLDIRNPMVDEYLTKPFGPRELRDAIRRSIDHKRR